jgi:hypothetical protein
MRLKEDHMSSEAEINELRSRMDEMEAEIHFLFKHLGVSYVKDPYFEKVKTAQVVDRIKKGDINGAIQMHRELFNSSQIEAQNAITELRTKLERK